MTEVTCTRCGVGRYYSHDNGVSCTSCAHTIAWTDLPDDDSLVFVNGYLNRNEAL